eukprot:GHVT01061628.1.p2 GENE.GHVT01061628.1~~GHVT01061628.1.p2  ORF type:complete len:238 (-),score=27.84 GHVT01061628.1:1187-1900(-)
MQPGNFAKMELPVAAIKDTPPIANAEVDKLSSSNVIDSHPTGDLTLACVHRPWNLHTPSPTNTQHPKKKGRFRSAFCFSWKRPAHGKNTQQPSTTPLAKTTFGERFRNKCRYSLAKIAAAPEVVSSALGKIVRPARRNRRQEVAKQPTEAQDLRVALWSTTTSKATATDSTAAPTALPPWRAFSTTFTSKAALRGFRGFKCRNGKRRGIRSNRFVRAPPPMLQYPSHNDYGHQALVQ